MTYRLTQTRPGDELWPCIERHSAQTVRYLANPNDVGDYHCFVAVDEDDAFMGLCIVSICRLGFGPLAEQTVACLENILVVEAHRRHGIGSTLLQKALSAAWESGAAHVWWTVEYENTSAIDFYVANGAVFIAEEDPDDKDPERYYTVVVPSPRNSGETKFQPEHGTDG